MSTAREQSNQKDNNVEIMCLQPHYVETKMIARSIEKKQDFGTVSVKDCVNGALRDLGYEVTTYGPRKHEFWGCFMSAILRYVSIPA